MSDSARTSDMQVIKSGSQDPIAGPAECFTGKVQISTLFNAQHLLALVLLWWSFQKELVQIGILIHSAKFY